MIVTALQSFDHDGAKYRRGQQLNITRATAKSLQEKGLISTNGLPDDVPTVADGEEPSSASPAAPVAPQKTSKPSVAGGTKKSKKSAA